MNQNKLTFESEGLTVDWISEMVFGKVIFSKTSNFIRLKNQRNYFTFDLQHSNYLFSSQFYLKSNLVRLLNSF